MVLPIDNQRVLTMENLWEIAGFIPNEEQKAAILQTEGPLFITAGPGSGKTRVLLWRTLNLIVFHQIKPAEVFLSTFTEKAAFQLKEGLRSLLAIVTNQTGVPYDLAPMYIGTVHSLCRRMLNDRQKFPTPKVNLRAPVLMDELSQFFHVHKTTVWDQLTSSIFLEGEEDAATHINSIFGTKSASRFKAINGCISFFNRVAEETINPDEAILVLQSENTELDDFLKENDLDKKRILEAFALYKKYRKTIEGEGRARRTDFSHLQQEALNLMVESIGPADAFKYIIIDEYQDTNPVQEKLIFKLAQLTHNVCVVGDDDQSLYRFRGATVENFVDFPQRCLHFFDQPPTRITLATNYRSRNAIVDFYGKYINEFNWKKPGQPGHFRVVDKDINAYRVDELPSVFTTDAAHPTTICPQIARVVKQLIDEKKVEDPNQIAFLFPSLKASAVQIMKNALEAEGLRVYAPRAGRFLETDEARDIFGLFALIFDLPEFAGSLSRETEEFYQWLIAIREKARGLCREDPFLNRYIEDRRAEIARITADYQTLIKVTRQSGWNLEQEYSISPMKRTLYNAPGLSQEARKIIGSEYLDRIVVRRKEQGRPFNLDYIITRATSLDWSVLDLFYRFCGFEHFVQMFDLAENGIDEGPVCNLGLITQYLARFMDEFIPLLKADHYVENLFQKIWYLSFLFSIYRLNESEYENADDPFPKGRIPFLTIHQSKGLEFPVVVLGNLRKNRWAPGFTEVALRPFTPRESAEPLDRVAEYDEARMFYVALSRAQNLLILPNYSGSGYWINEPFRRILKSDVPKLDELELESVPEFKEPPSDLPKMYSYTSDYLQYQKCPRQYMIFRKYGFVPSRAQTAFFGSLVHRTLDDLHRELIRRKKVAS